MARIVVGACLGFVAGIVLGAALSIHAEIEPSEEVQAVAAEVGLDPMLVLGALNSQPGVDVHDYLRFEGLLPERPTTTGAVAVGSSAVPPAAGLSAWPIGGALGQRIFCIEGIESHHGLAMWNPRAVWNGEHAQGFLGWLPSTARSVGVTIGNRSSEWAGAARMLATGRGNEFYGIQAHLC